MMCEICGCQEIDSYHHLIPRTVHTNKWFKKRYKRADLHQTVGVCKACHRAIHAMVPDEKELGRNYHTIEQLKAHPKMIKHVAWVRKKVGSVGT